MTAPEIKQSITANAEKIRQLHSRVRQTFQQRTQSEKRKQEWKEACRDLHANYNRLAFPGGYNNALARIIAGDPQTMEAAICFLEVRPYFFRSGYMFKDILRKLKKAPLSKESTRLEIILQKLDEWRRSKQLPRPHYSD